MDGQFGVESRLGQGSTFWLAVPLKKMVGAHSHLHQVTDHAELLIRRLFFGSRILIVDDDFLNQEVAKLQLESIGLMVDTATDGDSGLAMCRAHVYAAIFMDMSMPVMDGLEATRNIRNDSLNRKTPIIAMTANAFAEDRTKCLSAGMDEFLSKPFDPKELFSVLYDQLNRAGG